MRFRSTAIAVAMLVTVAAEAAGEGPIFVSQASIPAGIKYEVVGSVQANARVGYSSAESLYPMLAEERGRWARTQ